MEAVLQGVHREQRPTVTTMEVHDKSFVVFSVNDADNSLKAYINPPEYAEFGEELIRAGLAFLRLDRERAAKEAEQCPEPTAPSS